MLIIFNRKIDESMKLGWNQVTKAFRDIMAILEQKTENQNGDGRLSMNRGRKGIKNKKGIAG